MKVLLLAEPPAGDKVMKALISRKVEVEYRRGLKPAAMASAIRPGFGWVLVMNGNGMGTTLKSAAERHGAHYVAILPGWAQTERILRERGFPFEQEVPASAPPLTHRPLEPLALEKAKRTANPPVVVEPGQVEREVAHAIATMDQPGGALGTPLTPAKDSNTDQPVNEATVQQAKRILAKNPAIGSREILDLLRAAGHPANNNTRIEVALARRAARAAAGLNPDGYVKNGTSRRAAEPTEVTGPSPAEAAAALAQVLAVAPPAPPAQGEDLPATVRSAAQALAAALIDAGLEGSLTVATDGALSFDLEQRRRLSGRASF